MEETLRHILSTVNQWLTFAEAKNGALIALGGAAVFAAGGLLTGGQAPTGWVRWYLAQFILLVGLGLLCSLLSLLPRTRLHPSRTRADRSPGGNLLHYGDLAAYSPSQLLDEMRNALQLPACEATKMEQFLADQIIINSRITLHKYRCFGVGAWLVLTAIVTPAGALILYLVQRRFVK